MAPRPALGVMTRRSMTCAALLATCALGAGAAHGAVSGTVFRDYDADGLRDAREPGLAGITVTAYDSAARTAAQDVSGEDGAYSLAVPDGVQLRIEMTGRPEGFQWGPDGPDSGTSVQFVTSPRRGVDHGAARPSEFCERNPRLAVTCFAFGPSSAQPGFTGAGEPSVEDLPYSGPGGPRVAATHASTGAVWGLAHVARPGAGNGVLYAASFVKRHSGLGPNRDPGTIYRIPYAAGIAGTPEVLVTLPAGSDPHPPDDAGLDAWMRDRETWDAPGKVGLGDLDVSEDGTTLFAVNLADRRLYKVPTGGGAPTSVAIPQPTGCPAADWRPFGLGVDDGRVYVGVTCTAQSSQRADDRFAASVFASDLSVTSFSSRPVLVVPLDGAAYPRKCASPEEPAAFNASASDNANAGARCVGEGRSANWRPWLPPAPPTAFDSIVPRPMSPLLSDIEFDRGAMILGLRDRFGDQMGNGTPAPDGTLQGDFGGVAMGDVLRACGSPDRGWTLEANGVCGGVAGGGAGNGEGPGGGEFYNGDDNYWHDQTVAGGLAQVPGFEEVAATVFDPFPGREQTYDGGILWSDNASGVRTRSAIVQDGDYLARATFGKSNGLGDLEAVCSAAPVEIGNRVWIDANRDGLQGADEVGLANVALVLRDGSGNALATTVTDSAGGYRFTVEPNRDYRVTIDLSQPRLDIYRPTQAPSSSTRATIDSDGSFAGGQVVASIRTGGPGHNDHNLDFALAPAADYDILKEVFDPARGEWVDGDGDGGSRGANTGEPVVLRPGATARFRITVFNTGIVELRRVRVIDPYCGVDRVIARIAPGGQAVLTCQRQRVTSARVNVATVLQAIPVRVDGTGELPSLAARSESAAISVATATIASQARLAVVKVGPVRALSGQRVRYTLTVRVANRSPVAARNVRLVDTCGDGLTFVGARRLGKAENGFRTAARWSFGTLKPGESRTVAIIFRITPGRRGSVVNMASASAENAPAVSANAKTRVLATPPPRSVSVAG